MKAVLMEIDLDKKIVCQDVVDIQKSTDPIHAAAPRPMAVAACLSNPNVSTVLNSESISFSRAKAGVFGFRSDRTEVINGYNAKVFSASDIEFMTRTRTEHLSEAEKKKFKGGGLKKFFGFGEGSDSRQQQTNSTAVSQLAYWRSSDCLHCFIGCK
eukprot:m.183994 g.183994  ORF g.183994 m.183994 type:complete len:156 (+) comp39315_c0_seq24:615-1082(+)